MAQFIEKSALVAEIEKLIDEIYAGRPFDSLSSEQQTALWYIKSIMSSVNNLEVKEVDLEKEIQRQYEVHKNLDNNIVKNCVVMTKDGFEYFAKHFFELGLKAQPQQEWSEEDEKKLLCVCAWIKDYPRIADFKDEMYTVANNYINWLKSLRPQKQWKPSDKQIKGIECTIKTLQHQLNVGDKRLNSLYNDLKKLREE